MDTALADISDHDPAVFWCKWWNIFYWISSAWSNQLGQTGDEILLNAIQINSPTVVSRSYIYKIKPAEQWGSCHTDHDEGYTNIANYQYLVDLSKGLYLEMYHGGAHKRYQIKYI